MSSGVPIRVSVVVPAHDRASRLPGLITAIGTELDAHGGAELILVNSASTDATGSVIDAAAAARPDRVRAVHVRRPGACLARNAGADAARGGIVVFFDDDVRPRPGCLAALEAAHADPGVHAAGGRIVLAFETPQPPWLTRPFLTYLAAYDLGETPRDLTAAGDDACPRSACMSVRRDVLRDIGGFSHLFGPLRGRPMVGEEAELCRRIVARGGTLRWVPGATVDHDIPGSRITPAALARRFFYQGVTEAFWDIRFRGALAATAKLVRGARGRATGRAWDGASNADGNAMLTACRRRQSLGYVAGVALGLLRYPQLRRLGV